VEQGKPFDFFGVYRVQSKRTGKPSRLVGRWATVRLPVLSCASVNTLLRSDPHWRGQASINIRPAFIERRIGEFENEPDILYKRSHFDQHDNSEKMPSDIIDVCKASARWNGRRRFMVGLLGLENANVVEGLIGDIGHVATVEYYMHEAGHCIGYDTASKYRDTYFRVEGKTVWPLVYTEEFRADLLSFGFAASLLSTRMAAATFFYNVLLRLGSHVEGVKQNGCHSYGTIPFLLYASLRRFGVLLAPSKTCSAASLNFATLTPEDIVDHMRELDAWVRSEVVERIDVGGTDAALRAALFYRSILTQDIVEEFDEIVGSA
jgi:hypothetical protein